MVRELTRLANNIDQTIRELPDIFADEAEELGDQIADLNIEQLRKGKTSKDELITPSYESDLYANYKKAIGSKAPKGTPDLILEGDFIEGFYVEKRGNRILIDSKDVKTPKLEEKYDNIFGLTDSSREDLNKALIPNVIKRVEHGIFKRN